MEEVTYGDFTFVPYIKREEIAKQVKRLAQEIMRDYDQKNVLFLCVLNGAFIFAADLFRECDLHDAEIEFIRYKSYDGTQSSGKVKKITGLHVDIAGRNVLVVEDIIDSGRTAVQLREDLEKLNPQSVKFVSLLFKPESLTEGKGPEYVGFEIPPDFILGYGLDLYEKARNLPDIYVKKD